MLISICDFSPKRDKRILKRGLKNLTNGIQKVAALKIYNFGLCKARGGKDFILFFETKVRNKNQTKAS